MEIKSVTKELLTLEPVHVLIIRRSGHDELRCYEIVPWPNQKYV